MANYNVMYGSIGAGIALLVWMYVMAVVALLGCEFNAEYERSSAPPVPALARAPEAGTPERAPAPTGRH